MFQVGLLTLSFKRCRPIDKYLFKVSNKYTRAHEIYAGISQVVTLSGI